MDEVGKDHLGRDVKKMGKKQSPSSKLTVEPEEFHIPERGHKGGRRTPRY